MPGQPRFRLTRRLVLQGVDGLVFVWDSRSRRLRENVRSLLEAREAVEACGRDWERLPRVIQLNKQDLAPLTPRADIDAVLDRLGERGPRIASVAADGVGVLETLAAIARGRRGARSASAVPRAVGPAGALLEFPSMRRFWIRLGATFFFTGHFPVAPATFASFVTLAIWWLLPPLSPLLDAG